MPEHPDNQDCADPVVASALQGLPLPAPRESAWPAIAATLAARQRRARWRVAAPALAAALVAGVAITLFTRTPAPPATEVIAATPATSQPDATERGATRELIARNQALESRLQAPSRFASQDGAAALASVELEDLIAMLDLQLGATTDPRESAFLWQERLVLMEELAQLRSPSNVLADNGGSLRPASYLVD
jgi:hypothetical protein